MSTTIRRMASLGILVLAGFFARPASAGDAKAKAEAKEAERQIQIHNAARGDRGGRVSLELIGPKAGKDARNSPEEVADGSAHTRCVAWGPPYAYRIELVDKLPITDINFICSDYANEAAPRELEIKLSDGTTIPFKMEVQRPEKGKPLPRQNVKVGKEIEWLEVKVLTQDPGPANAEGKSVDWGGIGEIEVITTTDLDPYMAVPDYNADAPAFVEGASPRNDYTGLKTTMPTKIPLGEHPGIYLTRDEIVKMREAMKADPRCKAMLEKLMQTCDAWAAKEIVHPDPKVPAQMKDRGDAQAKAHGMMTKMAGWLGWAYQLTDDEKYAAKAREIVLGYAKLYPNDYAEHKGVHASDTSKVMAQRLSEAMWLLPLIQSYDLIYHAKCMTDDDRKLIENDLIRTCITFVQSKRPAKDEVASRDKSKPDWRTADPEVKKGQVGNWTNFYNAAFIQGGIVLKDQDWIDIGAANTRHNLANGIGDDGMWGEGAIGYHLFGRHGLICCVEALARQGIDLYGFQTCRFKNLFDSPFKYAYPDGTSPGIHDSGRVSVASDWTAMAYDFAYLRYRDPNYGRTVNECERQIFQSEGCYFPTVLYEKLPERPIVGFKSLIFDNLGYAILRGEDSGGPTFLLMDYGPHGGSHGHPDKLNIVLFADGDELAGEPQMYRYEDAHHAEWSRPTVAHWTVSVDQRSQMPATGKLLAFRDAGAVKVMRGVCGTAYPGVGIDRTVVQMPGYIADVYRCWGKTKHAYDYPLCFRGKLDALKDAKPEDLKPMASPVVRGYKHILIAEPRKTDAAWEGVWTREAVAAKPATDKDPAVSAVLPTRVKVTVLGGSPTVVHAGTVPGGRHEAVLRREGTAATFAAVINPFKDSDAVKSAEEIKLDGPVPGFGLKVLRADGGTDLILIRFDPQTENKLAAESSFPGGKTNALVSVVRLDAAAKAVDFGMLGGTALNCGDANLTLEAPGISWKK